MEHLQMCHLNGNNDDKEKGERDAISTKNTCRLAQGPIMGPSSDIFSGTFQESSVAWVWAWLGAAELARR